MLKKITISLTSIFLIITSLSAAERSRSPHFQITSSESALDSLPLKASKTKVSISGSIAQVELRQTYANTGGVPIEAVYIFPGSTRSAVHGMEMKIGEKIIVAQIKERKQARKTYEKAKAENKTASLLEQQRPNVFQMNVANILPGEEVEVLLCYSEHITATDGVYEFVMPTVVGPRYGANSDVNNTSTSVNPYIQPGAKTVPIFEFTMDLQTGLPLKEIFCTSHNSPIKYLSKQHASLSMKMRIFSSSILSPQHECYLNTYPHVIISLYLMSPALWTAFRSILHANFSMISPINYARMIPLMSYS